MRAAIEREEEIKDQLEVKIKALFQACQQGKKNGVLAFSREQKLHVLSDVFGTHYGEAFVDDMFPAFYSQDLIVFGLEHNVPEAVRLGEHMMSANGQTPSPDLQRAIKEYTLANAEGYRRAMKSTGPIDNASLYRASRRNPAPFVLNWDDPYWQDVFAKNWRRADQWKLPSALSWDHKRHGIIGEVIDMETIERQAKESMKSLRMPF